MEKKTDIALFLTSFEGGGAERIMLNLCQQFCERGLSVDLLIVNDKGPLRSLAPKGARLINFNCGKPSRAIFNLLKYLKKNKPFSFLSALTHANIAATIAYKLSRVETNLVLSERTDIKQDLHDRKSLFDKKITKKLIKLLYKRAKNIITVSKGSANSLKKISNIDSKKIKIIYNPINTIETKKLSEKYINIPWKDNLPIIISSGRFIISKDFSCLLEAFSILKQRSPSHLIILGEGELRQALHQLSISLNIENDVWLPGYSANPYPYMARAKLFVLPSRIEGLPNVLIEALALGIPIVSTNCPSGPEEILANGKYGRLVPVGDPVAMAEAMDKSLSGDHPVFDQKEALQRFDPELITDQYLEALGFHSLPHHSRLLP